MKSSSQLLSPCPFFSDDQRHMPLLILYQITTLCVVITILAKGSRPEPRLIDNLGSLTSGLTRSIILVSLASREDLLGSGSRSDST